MIQDRACAATHIYIDIATLLARENAIRSEDIESVTVFVGDFARNLCEPLEARRKPASTLDAKFSIPFTIATALVKGKVMLKDFAVENLKDPAVLDLAAKVTPVFDSKYDRARDTRAGKMEIKTRDGRAHVKVLDFPYGHPKRPMTWEDTVGKFRDCVSYAVTPVSQARVDRVIWAVKHLENLEDVGAIVRWLVPGVHSAKP
ncbi:MAG: MmgE/PrpD family protein [Chloroflexi bacterium]|nr:MmgE/PrpD family protein [Chloroflexota bacterium]